jgi:hypothetical protein
MRPFYSSAGWSFSQEKPSPSIAVACRHSTAWSIRLLVQQYDNAARIVCLRLKPVHCGTAERQPTDITTILLKLKRFFPRKTKLKANTG